MDLKTLFFDIYSAPIEDDLDNIIQNHTAALNNQIKWVPLGDNDSNFGVIENQQSSPVAALIEKITNSIDAILMKRCMEEGLDPKSSNSPRTVEDAVKRFFPKCQNWDLPTFRKQQALEIQIIADGPRFNTSLIVYDNGEGQHPWEFENTFLSLLRGNKNEIHFVQGKYNMGGTGAIVFCGKKRYHLIASRRYDKTGNFGFTLIRKHPFSSEEEKIKKNTWYEYLKINNSIPEFEIESLDLGLHERNFETGTILKLYSYQLPSGARSVISRDLNQSINEYLFEPALPVLTVDKEERYPKDQNLQRDLYGLKRRLEGADSKYVEDYFSENYEDKTLGSINVTCYVFKSKIDDRSIKQSRESIQREFFKNSMAVLFSINGQVHGHYTSEFVTRSLKFPLLKNHLLIHVDCTRLKLDFRNELFMASRDRLKKGEEASYLRDKLTYLLHKSRLKEINKQRKASISSDASDSQDLLKNLTRNLPLNNDLLKLLGQTFKLEKKRDNPPKNEVSTSKQRKKKETIDFEGKRFPTYLKISQSEKSNSMFKVPLGGEKTIRFLTDVENQYFDRIEDPGEFKVSLLTPKLNETIGGDKMGIPEELSEVFDVIRTSPNNGTIKIVLTPTKNVHVGDSFEIRASLDGAGDTYDQIFWVKIKEKEKQQDKKINDENVPNIGLPKNVLVYKNNNGNNLTWDSFEEMGIEFNRDVIVHPHVEGDTLDTIYINMDSSVLLDYRSGLKSEEQIQLANKRYISTVFFHTLFLYSINKHRRYEISKVGENEKEENVDLADYLKDLFSSFYSAFLLKFELSEIMDSLEV